MDNADADSGCGTGRASPRVHRRGEKSCGIILRVQTADVRGVWWLMPETT